MTEDNAKSKLTLSGKSTLTLKNLGDRVASREGKKMVQVEVRKKRVINPGAVDNSVKLDETTAMKLKLIAEAKEHEARRRQEEEEKERRRQEEREQEEKERLARLAEENAKKAEIIQDIKAAAKNNVPASDVEEKSFKSKEKKSKDYDDDEDASAAKKFHKAQIGRAHV